MRVLVLLGISAETKGIRGVKLSEREERRIKYLSRFVFTVDTNMLNEFCQGNNLNYLGCRKLPLKRGDMNSFHVVFFSN